MPITSLNNPSPEMLEEDTGSVSMEPEINYQELVAQLTAKNNEQSTNLINQREIIKQKDDQNKTLLAQLEELNKKVQELESRPTTAVTEFDIYSDPRFVEMERYYKTIQQKEAEQRLMPVVERMLEYGISQDKLNEVNEEIKTKLGIDITAVPDLDNLDYALNRLGYGLNTEPSTVPQGGYIPRNYQLNMQTKAEADFDAKVKAYEAQLEQEAMARYADRIRKY